MTNPIELYHLTNGTGCRLWAIPGEAWGGLTGILSDNLFQFDDASRAKIEELLGMGCEISGLIEDVSAIRSMLAGCCTPSQWESLPGNILYPPDPLPIERGVGIPPYGGSWEEYDSELCDYAAWTVDEHLRVLDEVAEWASWGGGIVASTLYAIMGVLCPPLTLVWGLAEALTLVVLDDALDEFRDDLAEMRQELICAVYGAYTPTEAAQNIEGVIAAHFTGAQAGILLALWNSKTINLVMGGGLVGVAIGTGDCTSCSEPAPPAQEAGWWFTTSEEGWQFTHQSPGAIGEWRDDPGRLYMWPGGEIIYRWCAWRINPGGLVVPVNGRLVATHRTTWNDGAGGDTFLRVTLTPPVGGGEAIQLQTNLPRTGVWELLQVDLSEYAGYYISEVMVYLRGRSSTIEIDDVVIDNHSGWEARHFEDIYSGTARGAIPSAMGSGTTYVDSLAMQIGTDPGRAAWTKMFASDRICRPGDRLYLRYTSPTTLSYGDLTVRHNGVIRGVIPLVVEFPGQVVEIDVDALGVNIEGFDEVEVSNGVLNSVLRVLEAKFYPAV